MEYRITKDVEVYQDEQIIRSWQASFSHHESIKIFAYSTSRKLLRNDQEEIIRFTTTGEPISQ